MAILWYKMEKGVRYEVRTAGRTRRLYTNGVFHSQYHPERAFTGGIWDLLMLPAFFLKPDRIRRVLVLGVGGGAVIRQIHRYIRPQSLVGVELNPVHLHVARHFFGINDSMAQLHEEDAIQWLQDYQGPPFDMIVEDLFGESEGEPVRAIKPGVDWFGLLAKHLTPEGILVMNFISKKDLRECAWFHHPSSTRRFASAFMFTLPVYDNAVGAFLKSTVEKTSLREKLTTVPGLGLALKNNQLNYRMRSLSPLHV